MKAIKKVHCLIMRFLILILLIPSDLMTVRHQGFHLTWRYLNRPNSHLIRFVINLIMCLVKINNYITELAVSYGGPVYILCILYEKSHIFSMSALSLVIYYRGNFLTFQHLGFLILSWTGHISI